MKKHIIYAAIAVSSLGLVSCSDILDQQPLDSFSDAAVWSDLSLSEAFLNNCYVRVEAENSGGVLFSNYTDESFHMHDYGTSNYTQGRVSCDDYNTGWTEGKGNTWAHYYGGVKLTNQFLEKIQSTPASKDGDQVWKDQLVGQAHFLRAYFYHMLYSVYGRVPIITKTYNLDSEFTETRADADAVADFIVQECDLAAKDLPVKYKDDSDFGRATKGAALALKGRTLLYKASPLFGTPSSEKWTAAAKANKEVIDLVDDSGQKVYSLKSVSNSTEYGALFLDSHSPEVIFEKLYDTKSVASSNASFIMQAPAGPGSGYGGWGTWQPTEEIVSKFQNADGTTFVAGQTKSYTILETVMDPATGQAIKKQKTIQATETNPWKNRDIRLAASIFTDGQTWGYGDSNREIELFEPAEEGVVGGKDSRVGESWWNGSKTGYNMRKFLDPNYNTYDETVANTTPWIFFRLSEIYLNYAECQMELGNTPEALKYINLIRTRALLPPAKGTNIHQEYEYERTAELVFEGQRFFDLRRWMKLENIYNKQPVTGVKVYKYKDGTKIYYHNPEVIQQRAFNAPKNYWWPIPRYELRRAPQLDAKPYE